MTTLKPTKLNRNRARGVSLVELMIALTIGLATVGAIGWIYIGTSKTYRTQDSLARLQEGARYAFEVISNDLRMAGATGCSYATKLNVINSPTTRWYTNPLDHPVLGLEQDDAAGTGAFNLTSDAISVLRADVSREYVVASHNNAGSFTFDTTTGLTAGDFLVATNCNHVSVFQTATVSSGAVTYSTGTSPGNSAVDLGVTYAPNSRAYRLVASTYYVDTNPAGQPALFRSRPAGASATPTAEELIEGVEDIQISYGVDTDATADRLPNFTRASDAVDPYLTADEVNSALVPGATAADKWSRVISVKISLLMRTVDDNVIPDSQTYTFNGADVTATDRRLRKVFTHVVRLRNR